jgi:hypothetical protein
MPSALTLAPTRKGSCVILQKSKQRKAKSFVSSHST